MIWEKKIATLQQILIKILETEFLPQDSYLAGGTALYFYLNHRVSVDIDFFNAEQEKDDILIVDNSSLFNVLTY